MSNNDYGLMLILVGGFLVCAPALGWHANWLDPSIEWLGGIVIIATGNIVGKLRD